MDYSKTVNLLQTPFPMKADLPTREPLQLKAWEEQSLYQKIQKERADSPVFLLHDGPPYANGVIHMGHALNKILKDFVVKYKSLSGFRSPYKPGWDCHGLPIEHQLFKQIGKNKHQVSRAEFRNQATGYALGFVNSQREDFKRLGVLGDWENPYLTLSNAYESAIVQTFFELKERGFIYKGLKPGYWCVYDETALAEAEVEYADKKSDSVYVRYKIAGEIIPHPALSPKGRGIPLRGVPSPHGGEEGQGEGSRSALLTLFKRENTYFLIWTTTPWTLPANKALALHPDEKYGLLKKGNDVYVVGDKLRNVVAKKIGADVVVDGPSFSGKDCEFLLTKNPLTKNESLVVNDTYVTMEDGTGIVHVAPGHGVEDFSVGLKYGLEVFSPVNEQGCFNETVKPTELKGKHVLKDANTKVMDILKNQGDLVFHQSHKHSYPHCWRCKNPIIFRATEQWFLRMVPEFREKLIESIQAVQWEPDFGVHRIQGMVEQRPDWCLSRQRHWGTPIPVFYCSNTKCAEVLWNAKLNAALVQFIREKGSNVYYEKSEAELFQLAGVAASCAKCGGKTFRKEMDILDVWFDSGVSWAAVIENDFKNPKPEKILYLEGSDQHRGWFQTSLIPSVALRGKAPYDIVLTHGFVMDGKGYKMSKSLGNVIAPQEIVQKYGADVLRLWVAMSDYREDVRLSQDIVKHMVDVYRRFRNTFRFLLQNTVDFNWRRHRVPFDRMEEIDKWILSHFEDVKRKVVKAYDAYEFHVVLSELNRFVAVELSGFYLDALKDRLYCEALDSPLRRSAQTAFYELARGLCVLLAPVLSFTSDEAYIELRKTSNADLPQSVFLDSMKALDTVFGEPSLKDKWSKILEVRRLINDELDRRRKEGVLKSSQEASVHIDSSKLDPELQSLLKKGDAEWPFLLQMAEVHINGQHSQASAVTIQPTKNAKCERCWRHRSEVGKASDHPTLCGRCAKVVKLSIGGRP